MLVILIDGFIYSMDHPAGRRVAYCFNAMTTRNPMEAGVVGSYEPRLADLQTAGELMDAPPRTTRSVPVAGPIGSVCDVLV